MKTLDDIELNGKRVIMRVDFNVPLDKNINVTDYTRIRGAIPSIKKILDEGASLILISHLGRPQKKIKAGEPIDKLSLKPILSALEKVLKKNNVKYKSAYFVGKSRGEEVKEKAQSLQAGEILLLENLRFHKEEEKGDEEFAKELASLGDVYINDAFGAAHRAHASTTIIAKYAKEKAAGYLLKREIDNADRVMKNAERPFVAIMGGVKVSDKIMIIEKLLEHVNTILIGGAMTFTFLKALGKKIGNSLCEDAKLDLAKSLLEKAKNKGVNFLLPADSVVADKFSADANSKVCFNDSIEDGWLGLDVGPATINIFSREILKAKTILWNGPMGVFEMEKFSQGTFHIAKAVVTASQNGAYVLVGGGDSAAAVTQSGYMKEVSDKNFYVSTGGGALLEYMEGKILPGVAALS